MSPSTLLVLLAFTCWTLFTITMASEQFVFGGAERERQISSSNDKETCDTMTEANLESPSPWAIMMTPTGMRTLIRTRTVAAGGQKVLQTNPVTIHNTMSNSSNALASSTSTICLAHIVNGDITQTETWSIMSSSEYWPIPPPTPSPIPTAVDINEELLERAERLWKGHTEHGKLKAREEELNEKENALTAGFKALHDSTDRHEERMKRELENLQGYADKLDHFSYSLLMMRDSQVKYIEGTWDREKKKAFLLCMTMTITLTTTWIVLRQPLFLFIGSVAWRFLRRVWTRRV